MQRLSQDAKSELRQAMQIRCRTLSGAERGLAAAKLSIFGRDLVARAKKIAVYHAYDYEINLTPLIKYCLMQGKEIYQPIAYKNTRVMCFAKYDEQAATIFSKADYIPKDTIEWYNLDLIFLPLVAADAKGTRLGKGGGYYDATLIKPEKVNQQPLLCGVGFALQMIDMLPREAWDKQLDYFLSEQGLIKF